MRWVCSLRRACAAVWLVLAFEPAAKADTDEQIPTPSARALLHGRRASRRVDDVGTEANTDTTYGRIDGDVGLVLGVGATFAARGPRAVLDARVRYLDTAGVFASYEDGAFVGSPSEPRRVLSGGFEIRPLFLARWLQGHEFGVGRLDLLVDSFGLELGAFVGQSSLSQPSGRSFDAKPGLQAGLGLEFPIAASASGPWIALHAGVRWSDRAIEGQPIVDAADRALFLSITLAYHQIMGVHVVDIGDAAPR